MKNLKTGEVVDYYATGKTKAISSALKEIIKIEKEGQMVGVYEGKDIVISRYQLYKPKSEIVMQPATLEKPYPEFGIRAEVEEMTGKGVASYEFTREKVFPGFEHPKGVKLVGKEVGTIEGISKTEGILGLEKGEVKGVYIQPIREEPTGFTVVAPSTSESVVGKSTSLTIPKTVETIKPEPQSLLAQQKVLLKEIAETVKPAPKTTEFPQTILGTQAFFSQVGTAYPKTEEKVITQREVPSGLTSAWEYYLTKQAQAPIETKTIHTKQETFPIQPKPISIEIKPKLQPIETSTKLMEKAKEMLELKTIEKQKMESKLVGKDVYEEKRAILEENILKQAIRVKQAQERVVTIAPPLQVISTAMVTGRVVKEKEKTSTVEKQIVPLKITEVLKTPTTLKTKFKLTTTKTTTKTTPVKPSIQMFKIPIFKKSSFTLQNLTKKKKHAKISMKNLFKIRPIKMPSEILRRGRKWEKF